MESIGVLLKEELVADVQKWLRRAKKGDEASFEQFYLACKSRILNYTYRFIGDYHASEELTQEVFFRAYRGLSRYEERETPLAWIYSIARNLSCNWIRAQRLRRHLSLDAPLRVVDGEKSLSDAIPSKEIGPGERLLKKERLAILQGAILSLDVSYREVVILCDLQGYEYCMAAEILGISTGTVGSRLSRARLKIAKKVKSKLNRSDSGVKEHLR
jgi:RNA polymerase sigma-70 factor, ECF subfamily